MSAPIPHTCKKIDRYVSFVEGLIGEEISKKDAGHIIDCFEEIREDNAALREWGENQEASVGDLKREILELEKDHDEKNEKIASLEAVVADLQKHIDNHQIISL